jgi:hypothetical protein
MNRREVGQPVELSDLTAVVKKRDEETHKGKKKNLSNGS